MGESDTNRALSYQRRAESAPPKLSEEIQRVLVTRQTAHEWNISLVSCAGWQAVWLRTCYDPDLTEKHEEMKRESAVPGLGASGYKVLDDPSHYDFADGSGDPWRRVLVRVPGIVNSRGVFDMDGDGSNIQYSSGQDDEEMVAEAQEDEEQWRALSLAQLKIHAGPYPLDREAIESGLIKSLRLNEHGQIAWENRLDPCTSDLSRLTGTLLNATDLVELAGHDGTYGALIEIKRGWLHQKFEACSGTHPNLLCIQRHRIYKKRVVGRVKPSIYWAKLNVAKY